jgi:anti-sigma factor RsiW
MSDESDDLAEVQRRLSEIQREKRRGIRWGMSRHTAERAIEAIAEDEPERIRPSGKSRRRKRHKRLL